MPAPFRFIYGYATTNPSGENYRVGQYGPVAVRLKPELKQFALQILNDSLQASDGKSYLQRRPTLHRMI